MEIKVIPATKGDIPVIDALARKIWYVHYPDIISMDQIAYMLDKFYSREALESQMEEGHRFHLVMNGYIPIGYLSESNNPEGDYFLHKFYIDPDHQRKGIGREVFEKVFAQKSDIQTLRLTVNRANYKSINFYFRLGFRIEKTADFDIGNGYFMNDFIMLRRY